ncbi:FHA domain-containing protein [Geodermatophilus maliterrae]|uniref:FHA domain-containing protein n=1 Tax=Geodermatophilus maliterrae TaxID=3162531 RepID=A0ABV3XEW4_9ACTN
MPDAGARAGLTRVGLAPGDGLVARFGDVVLLVRDDDADGGAATEELLGLVEAAAAEDQPGSAVAARLGGWVGGRPTADGTAFGVVAPVADGVVVLLRGAVSAEVEGPSGTTRLSGRQALTWVDHVVAGPFARVTVEGGAGSAAPVHPRSALRDGVVPARGFVLSPAGAGDPPAPAPAGDAAGGAAPGEDPPRESGPLRDTLTDARPPDVPADRRTEPSVTAHLQETAQAQEPDRLQETMLAPAPVGALVCEGGPTVLLDRDYVLGREPHNDPDVRSAVASPVVIRDPGNLVSRVHARVSVDGGRVYVRDAPSVSGTYVAGPGATEWTRIGTEPTPLLPDGSLRVGTQVFTFRATKAADAG